MGPSWCFEIWRCWKLGVIKVMMCIESCPLFTELGRIHERFLLQIMHVILSSGKRKQDQMYAWLTAKSVDVYIIYASRECIGCQLVDGRWKLSLIKYQKITRTTNPNDNAKILTQDEVNYEPMPSVPIHRTSSACLSSARRIVSSYLRSFSHSSRCLRRMA